MTVEIDNDSGFCFGVLSAIGKAEEELRNSDELFCLGDIVHNGIECERLQSLGLKTINHKQFGSLQDAKVLLRAHGEPPSTYQTARKNGITLIDATCHVVLKLQQRIHRQYQELDPSTGQIVIFGQKGHAEVLGLVGQTDGTAIVIESADEIDRINFNKDIFLYSQTTKSAASYNQLIEKIAEHVPADRKFIHNNTVCGQVSHRRENIREFASRHDVILFVSGRKSSNGKVLFNECLNVNPHSYMIESRDDIDFKPLDGAQSIGICGATSTPKWLMEECREFILAHFNDR
ncbi:MAG: 4-hydroxy-3-methylbut-2-enyl diphosphate reductase [Bacteroidaceae bacterium]|nr:4-hydroxy-3-methylbut-2-enyl diphosphate reductase [Bacteroidaceae bacterium]